MSSRHEQWNRLIEHGSALFELGEFQLSGFFHSFLLKAFVVSIGKCASTEENSADHGKWDNKCSFRRRYACCEYWRGRRRGVSRLDVRSDGTWSHVCDDRY